MLSTLTKSRELSHERERAVGSEIDFTNGLKGYTVMLVEVHFGKKEVHSQ